jgi:hypothetical protein
VRAGGDLAAALDAMPWRGTAFSSITNGDELPLGPARLDLAQLVRAGELLVERASTRRAGEIASVSA